MTAELEELLLTYAELGKYQEGEHLTRQHLAAKPMDPGLLGWLAIMVNAQERVTEAREAITAALAAEPDDVRLLWINGNVHQAAGQYDEALRSMSRAARIDPHDIDALTGKARMLGALERWDDAIATLREGARRHPENFQIATQMAAAHMIINDFDGAESWHHEALRIRPDHGETWQGLGFLHATRGRVAQAQEAFTQAMRLQPRLQAAHYLAMSLFDGFERSLVPMALLPITTGILGAATSSAALSVVITLGVGALAIDGIVQQFRGGRIAWEAMSHSDLATWCGYATGMLAMFAGQSLLVLAVTTGPVALAWWTLLPVAAQWCCAAFEMSVAPDEDRRVRLPARMRHNAKLLAKAGFGTLWRRITFRERPIVIPTR